MIKKRNFVKTALISVGLVLLLVGCDSESVNQASNQGYPGLSDTEKGAGMGAVTGAAAGGVVAGPIGIPVGAAIGGVTGGAVGYQQPMPTSNQRLINAGVKIFVVGESVKVILPTDNFFGPGSYGLNADYIPVMEDVLNYIKPYDKSIILVTGYTAKTDDPLRDKALSLQRAQIISEYLTDHHVQAQLVYAEGLGDAYPVASNKTSLGQAANNRIEITFQQVASPIL